MVKILCVSRHTVKQFGLWTAAFGAAFLLLASSALAAFPGTAGRIAFARYPRGSAPFEEIYTVKPNGNGLTRLTNSGGARVSNVLPDWNAAGTRIAYSHSTLDGSKIQIVRPNGAIVDSFGDPACAGGAIDSSWAPSGNVLAYACPDGHQGQYIKTIDLTTGARTTIGTPGPDSFEARPEFSPSGDAIAYSRAVAGGAYDEIVVAYLDGSGNLDHTETIAGSTTEDVIAPDWSPDGNDLIYECAPLSPASDPDICMAPVAAPHTETTLVGGPAADAGPAFAPTGNRIVWASGPEDSDMEIKVKNLTTGTVQTVTSDPVVDEEPDWGVG